MGGFHRDGRTKAAALEGCGRAEGYIEVEIMSISSGQSRPLLYLDDISDQI